MIYVTLSMELSGRDDMKLFLKWHDACIFAPLFLERRKNKEHKRGSINAFSAEFSVSP